MAAVRISIGNLAWFAKNIHSGERHSFAVLNPAKLKKGGRQYTALGGGAMLTPKGKDVLETMFGASNFEKDEHTGLYDARFQIGNETDYEQVFAMFAKLSSEFEQNPTLDIMAELEFSDLEGTILSPNDTQGIRPVFIRSVEQALAETGKDTSGRASVDIPTRRLFRIFELQMSGPVFEKFAGSPMVRFFTEAELQTTNFGATGGKTADGVPIQNNLFLF